MNRNRTGNFVRAIAGLASVLFCCSCNLNTVSELLDDKDPFNDVVVLQEMRNINAVGLTWQEDPEADRYVVRRSIYNDNGFVEFNEVYQGAEREYIDRNITIAVTYAYRLDKMKEGTTFEGDEYVYYFRPEPLNGVITAQSVNEGRSAYLSWEADENADSYIVLRTEATDDGVDFTNDDITQKITLGNVHSYIDNTISVEKTYAYRLVTICGGDEFEGTEVTFFGKTRPDPFPGRITAQNLNKGKSAYLSWEEDPGADKYLIMRAIDNGGPLEFKERKVGEEDEFYMQGATSAIDSTLDDTMGYFYRLDKIRGTEVFEGTEITFFGKTRPDPFPGVITAQNLNKGKSAYLTWEEDPGADKYRVMRAEDNGGPLEFKERVHTKDGFSMQGATSAIDSTLDDAKGYFYRLDKIRELDKILEEEVFEGTEITFFKKTRPDPFPGRITAQNLNNGKSAYLSWEEDPGADKYRIMRAEDNGGPLEFKERVHTKEGFSMQDATSAIDSTLDDDVGYFYRLDKRRDEVWIPGTEITTFSRTRPMPVEEAPEVISFNLEGKIIVQWNYDEGADTYVLLRRRDDATEKEKEYSEVYRGTDEQFDDIRVEEDGHYVYKLNKIRNDTEYGKEWRDNLGYGVAIPKEIDDHEPNNKEQDATILEATLEGNLYCYSFTESKIRLEDTDWYKVSIPPGKVANIRVAYSRFDGQIDSEGKTYFNLDIPYLQTKTIEHNIEFQVRNEGRYQRYVPFAISPDAGDFLNFDGTGGGLESYTITWVSITDNG